MDTMSITLAREVEALVRWKDDATRTLAERTDALEKTQTLLEESESMGRALRTAMGRTVAAKVAAETERDQALWAQGVAESRLEIAEEMADRLVGVICREAAARAELEDALDSSVDTIANMVDRIFTARGERDDARRRAEEAERVIAANRTCRCARAEA